MSETLREKGTYLLLIRCLNDTKRKVGSLGLLTLHSNKTYICRLSIWPRRLTEQSKKALK
ncbi:MAG: hypothetical protein DRO08_02900 [Thermoprotei archaeon]|nr:MAG: hypothetical protein DRO08_02900 [Thermoprotei archaeon]